MAFSQVLAWIAKLFDTFASAMCVVVVELIFTSRKADDFCISDDCKGCAKSPRTLCESSCITALSGFWKGSHSSRHGFENNAETASNELSSITAVARLAKKLDLWISDMHCCVLLCGFVVEPFTLVILSSNWNVLWRSYKLHEGSLWAFKSIL